jgi:hypothetical protein
MDFVPIIKKDPEHWDIFTSKEEYVSPFRDQHGRFPYYLSSHRNIFEPSTSQYLLEQGCRFKYPDNKPFAVCLTHDIDILYHTKRAKLVEGVTHLRHGNVSNACESFMQMRSKRMPCWNFSDIMALEEKFGAKSSFYFMVEDPGDQDYNYPIDDCMEIMREMVGRGWEVGLHGGHTTYNNPSRMKEKKQRLERVLNKPVSGYRSHYLRFQIPDTWEYLRSAGFLYDTTFGYADCIGFRNGMCHPFRPFNRVTGCEIDILEIPLMVMDSTLENYMKLDETTSWEMVKLMIDTVEKNHGVLTILWHNFLFFSDQIKLYEKILAYCAEKNAWMTTGNDIAIWWKDKAEG